MKEDILHVQHSLEAIVDPVLTSGAVQASAKSTPARIPIFRHYGVDLGDGTVAHLRGDAFLAASSACIQRTSLDDFAGQNEIKVDQVTQAAYSPKEVVERAIEEVGTDFGGYNLLTNNCEHFAFWCATGKRTSRQVYFLNDDQDIVEKALDRAFEPLIIFGDFVDRLFGWGDHKRSE